MLAHRADEFVAWIDEQLPRATHVETQGTPHWPQGEPRNYDLLPGTIVKEGPIHPYYEELASLVCNTFCTTVMYSPSELSYMNVHIAKGPSITHGWHRDTNPLTALIYLTTNRTGELETEDGRIVAPTKGSVLVMAGKKVLHQVRPLARGERRIVCVANFYTAEDQCERDPRLDALLYG